MDGHDEGLTCGDRFFCTKEIAAVRVEASIRQRAHAVSGYRSPASNSQNAA